MPITGAQSVTEGFETDGPEARIIALRAELQTLLDQTMAERDLERGRRRGALNRRIHDLSHMLRRDWPYASQAGQDLVIDRLTGARRGGTFVDIGGYDGVTGSNSLFFERERGWTGILVEPVPALAARARAARRSPVLELAIAPMDGEADFIEIAAGFTQMGGLADSYDPRLLDRVRADSRHVERCVRVSTRSLSRLLGEAGLPHPDVISLDIEGGEIAVLEGFPFDRHRVGIWTIENNSGGPELGRIMRASGHDLIDFCGADEIWRRRTR